MAPDTPERLVGATPAFVARGGDHRRERPVDARGRDLGGRGARDPLHQIRIPGAAQTDVVGEYGRVLDVTVSVHGVDSVDDGDP